MSSPTLGDVYDAHELHRDYLNRRINNHTATKRLSRHVGKLGAYDKKTRSKLDQVIDGTLAPMRAQQLPEPSDVLAAVYRLDPSG